MSKLLTEAWGDVKRELLSGLTGKRQSNLDILLENNRRALLRESATAGATSAGNIATLTKVILPILRRVMPTVIANEIVGVQPMVGPVAQIQTLRVRYGDNYGGVIAGEEALSPWKIAAAYSGNGNVNAPGADATSNMEGRPGNKLNIQIVKQTVEAKPRKMSARWTFEAAQDADAQYGLNLEAEVLAAVAQHLTTEIDQEVLWALRNLANVEEVYDQSLVSGTATFVGDEHAALAIQMNRVSNLIAQRTRHGAGNWAVISNQALTILQSASTSAFARTTEGTFEAPTNTKFVGTLNGSMRLYVDSYLQDTPAYNDNQILIGYKGPGESDAAAFYCPYIPLMSTGMVLDPNTYEMTTGFLTRYGFATMTNTASSLGNSADYLGKVSINTAKTSYK